MAPCKSFKPVWRCWLHSLQFISSSDFSLYQQMSSWINPHFSEWNLSQSIKSKWQEKHSFESIRILLTISSGISSWHRAWFLSFWPIFVSPCHESKRLRSRLITAFVSWCRSTIDKTSNEKMEQRGLAEKTEQRQRRFLKESCVERWRRAEERKLRRCKRRALKQKIDKKMLRRFVFSSLYFSLISFWLLTKVHSLNSSPTKSNHYPSRAAVHYKNLKLFRSFAFRIFQFFFLLQCFML